MLYVTTDNAQWGAGVGRDLQPAEIDGNFYELRKALNDLIANPGSPIEIVSFTVNGTAVTANMSDGSTIGPIYLPVLQFHWRDEWEPNAQYEELDIFKVTGNGLYSVVKNHTSGPTFDASIQVDSANALLQLFAFAPAQNLIYDVGFYYPGRLSDITSDVTYLYQEPVVRKIILPVTPFSGSAHQVYLQTPPSTNDQDFNVYQDDTLIGTLHVTAGNNVGSMTITADTTFNIGSRLAVGKAAVSDPNAAGLSVIFAAQQVLL